MIVNGKNDGARGIASVVQCLEFYTSEDENTKLELKTHSVPYNWGLKGVIEFKIGRAHV